MKKFFGSLLLIGICVVIAYADVPPYINYQGRLRQNNVPMTGNQTITFGIYDASSGGGNPFNEEKSVAVPTGVFNHQIGSVGVLSGEVFYSGTAERWLEIQVGSQPLAPREKFTTVPYAFVAQQLSPEVKTEAQLKVLVPKAVGLVYYDSDNKSLVLSTGTSAGQFGQINNGTQTPNGW